MVRSSKRLIELVRASPCLYDRRHPDYLHVGVKRDLWATIARQMDLPTVKCKTRWNNMRDSYRKATLKKSKTYKYSRQMAFLSPFLRQEAGGGHALEDGSDADDRDGEWDDRSSSNACKEEPVGADAAEEPSTYYLPEFRDAGAEPEPGAPEPPLAPYVCPDHPVDAFLSGIAPPLKSLPPYDLSLAKMEIYQVVHRYELKAIRDRQPASGADRTEGAPPPPLAGPDHRVAGGQGDSSI